MKKIFLMIFIVSISTISSQAQDFRFGLQASPTFSWMKSNDNQIQSNGTSLGLSFGVFGEYFFTEKYSLTGGLGLAVNQGGTLQHNQGGKYWVNSELSDEKLVTVTDKTNLKYNIQYIELPVSLKLRTEQFGLLKYFAELPIFTIGYKSNAKGTISGGDGSDNSENENIKPDVAPFNISWGLGAGAEYNINASTDIVLGLYFKQSLIDVTKNDGIKADGNKEDSKGTINTVSIRVGIMF